MRRPLRSLPYVVVVMLMLAAPSMAHAFPSFARAYGVSCSTCHVAFPRRNEFGDAFRKAGYHMPGSTGVNAVGSAIEPVTVRGNSLFEGYLPAAFPFAAEGTIAASYTNDRTVKPAFGIGSPSITLLAGTALSEHFSVIAIWNPQGPPAQLFMHVARIFNRPELNIIVGHFEETKTLFRSNEALLGDYLTNTSVVNGNVVAAPRNGIELNGVLLRRGFYAVGVGQEDALGPNFQSYYQLSLKLGGLDFLGESADADLDLDAEPSFWDGVSLTVAHWGYFGKVADPSQPIRADIRRVGLDAKLQVHKLAVWGSVMLGLDVDERLNRQSHALIGFGEVSYAITSWLLPVYVYQFRDTATQQQVFQQHYVGLLFSPFENVQARLLGVILDDNKNDEVVELRLNFAI